MSTLQPAMGVLAAEIRVGMLMQHAKTSLNGLVIDRGVGNHGMGWIQSMR